MFQPLTAKPVLITPVPGSTVKSSIDSVKFSKLERTKTALICGSVANEKSKHTPGHGLMRVLLPLYLHLLRWIVELTRYVLKGEKTTSSSSEFTASRAALIAVVSSVASCISKSSTCSFTIIMSSLSIIRHREAESNTIPMSHDGLIPSQIDTFDSWIQLMRFSCRGKVEPHKTRVFTLHARQLQGHSINDGNMVSGFRMKEKMYRKLVTLPCQFLQPLSDTAWRKFQFCVPRLRSKNTGGNDRSRIIKNLISTHSMNPLFEGKYSTVGKAVS